MTSARRTKQVEQEQVERRAKQLFDASIAGSDPQQWENVTDVTREQYRERARAELAAASSDDGDDGKEE